MFIADSQLLRMVPRGFQKPTTNRFRVGAPANVHIIGMNLEILAPNSNLGLGSGRLAVVRETAQRANACNSAQEEKACVALSPEAGFPIILTAQALTGEGNEQLNVCPASSPPGFVAVVFG